MKLSRLINYLHTGLSVYLAFGWVLPDIHNKILIGIIPCVYVNWLLDNNKCIITKLENHFLKKENIKSDIVSLEKYQGFVSNKLKYINIELSDKEIDNISVIVMFHSFLQCYKNLIIKI